MGAAELTAGAKRPASNAKARMIQASGPHVCGASSTTALEVGRRAFMAPSGQTNSMPPPARRPQTGHPRSKRLSHQGLWRCCRNGHLRDGPRKSRQRACEGTRNVGLPDREGQLGAPTGLEARRAGIKMRTTDTSGSSAKTGLRGRLPAADRQNLRWVMPTQGGNDVQGRRSIQAALFVARPSCPGRKGREKPETGAGER